MNAFIAVLGITIAIIGIAFVIAVLSALGTLLPEGSYLQELFSGVQTNSGTFFETSWNWILFIFSYYQAIAIFVCVIFLMGIIYSKFMLHEVKKAKKYAIAESARKEAELLARAPKTKERAKWEVVESHERSENPSDWRLAILEADVLLDELLDKLGYQGDSLGEKLKQVSHSEMATLDSAWEAHKIRNAIAHEGSGFTLTKAEASRVINLFQSVFQEFDFI